MVPATTVSVLCAGWQVHEGGRLPGWLDLVSPDPHTVPDTQDVMTPRVPRGQISL